MNEEIKRRKSDAEMDSSLPSENHKESDRLKSDFLPLTDGLTRRVRHVSCQPTSRGCI